MLLCLVMASVAGVMVVMAIMFAVAAVKVDGLSEKLDESRRTIGRAEPPPAVPAPRDDSLLQDRLREIQGEMAAERQARASEMERINTRTAELEARQAQLKDSLARAPAAAPDEVKAPAEAPAPPASSEPLVPAEPAAAPFAPLAPKALEAARTLIEGKIGLAEGKKKAGDLEGAMTLLKQAETAADEGGANRCAACTGNGSTPCVPTVAPCARCTGSGRIPSPVRLADGAPAPDINCYDCSGKGTEGRCPKCAGRGRIDCGLCGATGNPHHGLMARIDTRLEELERALQWIPCEACKGTKTCTPCKGEGTKKCVVCEGKGKTTMTVACARCAGSKTVSCPKTQAVSCASCKGGLVLCTTCGGLRSTRCASCNGTAINRGGLRCADCNATGAKACGACGAKGGKPCAACSGKTQPCAACAGKGKKTCDKCSGAGGAGLQRDCSKCRAGVHSCPDCSGSKRCASCQGRGRVKAVRIPGKSP